MNNFKDLVNDYVTLCGYTQNKAMYAATKTIEQDG